MTTSTQNTTTSTNDLTQELQYTQFDEHELIDNDHQPLLSIQKENYPFGDIITDVKPENAIRIYYKNVNGIRTYNTLDTWNEACNSLHKLSVDISGTSETNINWNEKNRTEARNIMQKYTQSVVINTSSSIEITKNNVSTRWNRQNLNWKRNR
jgi:hypothetical protein